MFLKNILTMYQRAIIQRPILSQAIQVGVLMGTGDMISQIVIEKNSFTNFDKVRTLKFTTIGFFMVGPSLRTWYGILNTYVGSKGKTVVLKKVVLDQLLFAPVLLFCLLTVIGFSHGNNWVQVKKNLEKNYTDVVITNWCLWPWVQIANFYYVPLQYQVLIVQIVALAWNTYLAWKTNRQDRIIKE